MSSQQKPPRRWRTRTVAGIAAASLLLAVAGCASDGGGSGTAQSDEGKLTLAFWGDASGISYYEQLIKMFNKQYPDIKIDIQPIAAQNQAGYASAIATRIAGGEDLDLVLLATEGLQLFGSKGLLEPLDPYMKKNAEFVDSYWKDVDPNLRKWNSELASSDGGTYAIPGGFNTMGLYCNKDLFDAAGVTLPEADWTWDEFKAAGEAIKSATGAYLTNVGSGQFTDVMPWLTTNGASTLSADWKQATYDTPEAVEAVEFAKSLVDDGLSPIPGGQFDAVTQLEQGKLACLGAGRWVNAQFKDLGLTDKTRVLNWPTKSTKGTVAGWDAWTILSSSKHKDLAWNYLEFFMSDEVGQFLASAGGSIPARISVAKSPAFTDGSPAGVELLADAVGFATPVPSPASGGEIQRIVEEAWLAIVTGASDAQSTLKAANAKIQALL